MKTGIELITEERQRQIDKEGWTAEHDQQHSYNDLAVAGACYAMAHKFRHHIKPKLIFIVAEIVGWPWSEKWWKPSPDNRLKELVKAGALIAAAIDRLQNDNNEY